LVPVTFAFFTTCGAAIVAGSDRMKSDSGRPTTYDPKGS
jgi:hypothetical protein